MTGLPIPTDRFRQVILHVALVPAPSKTGTPNPDAIAQLSAKVASSKPLDYFLKEVDALYGCKKTVLASGLAAAFLGQQLKLEDFLTRVHNNYMTLPATFHFIFKSKTQADWSLVCQAVAWLVAGISGPAEAKTSPQPQITADCVRQVLLRVPLVPTASKHGTPNLEAIARLSAKVAVSSPPQYYLDELEALFGCKKTVLASSLAAACLCQSSKIDIFLTKVHGNFVTLPPTFHFLFTAKQKSEWDIVCQAVRLLVELANGAARVKGNAGESLGDALITERWFLTVQRATNLLSPICETILHLAFGSEGQNFYTVCHEQTDSRLQVLNSTVVFQDKGSPFEIVRIPRTNLVLLEIAFLEWMPEGGYVHVDPKPQKTAISDFSKGDLVLSAKRPPLSTCFELIEIGDGYVGFLVAGQHGLWLTKENGLPKIVARAESLYGQSFYLEETCEADWESRACSSQCERDQNCCRANEDCIYYCLTGDCRVLRSDGAFIRVCDVAVGDSVCLFGGKSDIVEACVCTELSAPREFVTLPNGVCLTNGHPVMTEEGELVTISSANSRASSNQWMRPKHLFPPELRNVPCIYNFVLRSRGALLVTGPAVPCPQIPLFAICGSLGQFCPGVDESASFLGSEAVVNSLKANSQWPNIRGSPRV